MVTGGSSGAGLSRPSAVVTAFDPPYTRFAFVHSRLTVLRPVCSLSAAHPLSIKPLVCEHDQLCVEARLKEHWAENKHRNAWPMSTDGCVMIGVVLCCAAGVRRGCVRRCRRRIRRAWVSCGWCAGRSSTETIKLYAR